MFDDNLFSVKYFNSFSSKHQIKTLDAKTSSKLLWNVKLRKIAQNNYTINKYIWI